MAVYKVIQDVEAEDKLLGPLSFKSFIYAGIALLCGFINFKLLLLGTPIKWLLLIVFLLPMLLFGVLASPLGRDQPTEVWLLSRVRFFLKPRTRTWDQEGLEELVTITAPKKIEQRLTKDITPNEVESRLKALAATLDTRGWAVKNVDVNLNVAEQAGGPVVGPSASDRLVADAGYTQDAEVVDVHPADDILDEQNNPTAQKFAGLMQQADDDRRQGLMATMKGLKLPASTDLQRRLAQARASFGAGRTGSSSKKTTASRAKTGLARQPASPTQPKPPTPVTPERQAVNMELAQSGNDLSVASIAQLANHQPSIEQTGPNEVTISLH